MKRIFSIALVDSLKKSREYFSPDVGRGGVGRWPSIRCVMETQHGFERCVGASDR